MAIDQVKDIGTTAIPRVIGEAFSVVDASYELDLDDRLAYRFASRFPTEASWQQATARR